MTADFRSRTLSITAPEVCLPPSAPAPTTMDALALAARLACSLRTARRYLEAWAGAQARPDVPRVRRVHGPGRGRPHHEADAAGVERWLLGATADVGVAA